MIGRAYMKPYHRVSTLDDMVYLSKNLRYEDKREVEALGHTPEKALALGFGNSSICRSIIDARGTPVGVYGVVPLSDKIGQIWMLGSQGLVKIKTSFLKQSRSEVEGMNIMYPHLCNFIDSRNEIHLKWIRWCGFKIIGEKMINNVKFYEFCKVAI